MKAFIYITPKPGILDPQGDAVGRALSTLGFVGVQDVRMGKLVEMRLPEESLEKAEGQVRKMCEDVLTNPVIETYRYRLEPEDDAS